MPTTPDDKKTRILDTAADMFANRPFHKVLLSDVAREAAVGKGTLYLYFENKDELFVAVLFREFGGMLDRLTEEVADSSAPPDEQLRSMIHTIVDHIAKRVALTELMRNAMVSCGRSEAWRARRQALRDLIESVIRRGIDEGMFEDAEPSLTAQYITGLIRSACLFPPDGATPDDIAHHACNFVFKGLVHSG